MTRPGAPAPGFRRQTHSVDGVRITSLIGGQGPPLVLLHGWPQTSRAWLPVAPSLADAGYTVIAPDLPGLGESDPLPVGYGKDAVADALRALVRGLVGEGPLRVVGRRDELDTTREASPLRVADGAVVIDSSDLDARDVADRVMSLVAALAGGN